MPDDQKIVDKPAIAVERPEVGESGAMPAVPDPVQAVQQLQANGVGLGLDPDAVHAVVEGHPNMSRNQGWDIFKFIRKHGIQDVLELGFNWGVSTCYMGAALDRNGGGSIISIDLASRAAFEPGIEGFMKTLGLGDMLTVFYEHTSYTWRLRDFLRMDVPPSFDLVFLDGGHFFEPDGLAFIMAEKMLRPGGFFIFDDLNWSLGKSPFHKDQPETRALPREERDTPHVREIFELLVKPHPNIAETWENSAWGFARKKTQAELDPETVSREILRRKAGISASIARQRFPNKITNC